VEESLKAPSEGVGVSRVEGLRQVNIFVLRASRSAYGPEAATSVRRSLNTSAGFHARIATCRGHPDGRKSGWGRGFSVARASPAFFAPPGLVAKSPRLSNTLHVS
jgi:hypothetical protein